jgi:hypothetical protein
MNLFIYLYLQIKVIKVNNVYNTKKVILCNNNLYFFFIVEWNNKSMWLYKCAFFRHFLPHFTTNKRRVVWWIDGKCIVMPNMAILSPWFDARWPQASTVCHTVPHSAAWLMTQWGHSCVLPPYNIIQIIKPQRAKIKAQILRNEH